MSKLRMFNAAPIVLACWGMLVPTANLRAEEAASTETKVAAKITDVALGDGGVAVGVVVDGQGKPVDGASVAIKTDSKVVATVVTDEKGEFAVREMRGGIYEIQAPQGAAVFRFWTAKAAPPAAKNRMTLVSDAKLVRGQCGEHGCNTGGLFGGGGGAPTVTDGGYWGNNAGSVIGDSVGNGFSHGGGMFDGYVDGGMYDGGFVDGGYCPPGTTPVYSGGSGLGLGLFGGGFLGTAAVIGGTVAIGAVIADELDDDDPVSP